MNEWGLSKKAFWDVPFEKIDFDKQSRFVIEKVFNYGSWNDQLAIMRYYGLDTIKKEVVQVPYFRKPVLAFLSSYFNLPKSAFKCYTKKQSLMQPWPY
jgi:hypothetical protein